MAVVVSKKKSGETKMSRMFVNMLSLFFVY